MRGYSNLYIVGFAAAVCLVCAIFVSSSAVGLADEQAANKLLDRQTKILVVAGLMEEGASLTAEQVGQIFTDSIVAKAVVLETGEFADDIDTITYDQRKATRDPATSILAPANKAQVKRLAKVALVYQVVDAGKVTMHILPVEGKGLWSTLYGYMALSADLQLVQGLTFYEHGETPGLGGEVDNPRWKALWKGRKLYNAKGELAIEVIKGQAGSVADDPHRVDGLSGATITARGVSHLVKLWLGDDGFGPYLARLRSKSNLSQPGA